MVHHGDLVIIKKSGTDGGRLPLTKSTFVIGRSENADVRIHLPDVQDEQCELNFENEEWILINRNVDHPTLVNDKPVVDRIAVSFGDVMSVASRKMRFEQAALQDQSQPLDNPEPKILSPVNGKPKAESPVLPDIRVTPPNDDESISLAPILIGKSGRDETPARIVEELIDDVVAAEENEANEEQEPNAEEFQEEIEENETKEKQDEVVEEFEEETEESAEPTEPETLDLTGTESVRTDTTQWTHGSDRTPLSTPKAEDEVEMSNKDLEEEWEDLGLQETNEDVLEAQESNKSHSDGSAFLSPELNSSSTIAEPGTPVEKTEEHLSVRRSSRVSSRSAAESPEPTTPVQLKASPKSAKRRSPRTPYTPSQPITPLSARSSRKASAQATPTMFDDVDSTAIEDPTLNLGSLVSKVMEEMKLHPPKSTQKRTLSPTKVKASERFGSPERETPSPENEIEPRSPVPASNVFEEICPVADAGYRKSITPRTMFGKSATVANIRTPKSSLRPSRREQLIESERKTVAFSPKVDTKEIPKIGTTSYRQWCIEEEESEQREKEKAEKRKSRTPKSAKKTTPKSRTASPKDKTPKRESRSAKKSLRKSSAKKSPSPKSSRKSRSRKSLESPPPYPNFEPITPENSSDDDTVVAESLVGDWSVGQLPTLDESSMPQLDPLTPTERRKTRHSFSEQMPTPAAPVLEKFTPSSGRKRSFSDGEPQLPNPSPKTPRVSGVKGLLRSPSSSQSPVIGGVKQMVQTPKDPSTPWMTGVKRLLHRQSANRASPVVDGVKALMASEPVAKSPRLAGVKTLLKTPKSIDSPKLSGIKRAVKTPKAEKSPRLAGVKQLMRSGSAARPSPRVAGIKRMMHQSPSAPSPKVSGVKQLLKSPRSPRSPRLSGIEQMLETPEPTVASRPQSRVRSSRRKELEPLSVDVETDDAEQLLAPKVNAKPQKTRGARKIMDIKVQTPSPKAKKRPGRKTTRAQNRIPLVSPVVVLSPLRENGADYFEEDSPGPSRTRKAAAAKKSPKPRATKATAIAASTEIAKKRPARGKAVKESSVEPEKPASRRRKVTEESHPEEKQEAPAPKRTKRAAARKEKPEPKTEPKAASPAPVAKPTRNTRRTVPDVEEPKETVVPQKRATRRAKPDPTLTSQSEQTEKSKRKEPLKKKEAEKAEETKPAARKARKTAAESPKPTRTLRARAAKK